MLVSECGVVLSTASTSQQWLTYCLLVLLYLAKKNKNISCFFVFLVVLCCFLALQRPTTVLPTTTARNRSTHPYYLRAHDVLNQLFDWLVLTSFLVSLFFRPPLLHHEKTSLKIEVKKEEARKKQ